LDRRFIDLRNSVDRAQAADSRTLMLGPKAPENEGSRLSCEVAFLSHYEAVSTLCKGVDASGLAVFAVDEDGIAARALLTASSTQIRAAVVGRHSRAEIWLGDDASLALRHLAILVCPHAPGEAIRYRVIDLRTESGFTDERQVPLKAFEADGPVFIELGRYVLLFMTLDGSLMWPEDPMQAWRALPRREYRAESHQWRHVRRRRVEHRDATATGVQIMAGPVDIQRNLVMNDESSVAMLTVASSAGVARLQVGPQALKTGVLLGRYDRCDSGDLFVLDHPDISRVHLLVTEVDDVVYALDVASTNGVWLNRTEVQVLEVITKTALELGHDLATVTIERQR
jgi:hypothetical protein